jgi:hypothetical protein
MAETRARAHGDLGYPGYIKSLCINAGCHRKKEKTGKDQMLCSHFLSSFVKLDTFTIETANYQGKPLCNLGEHLVFGTGLLMPLT